MRAHQPGGELRDMPWWGQVLVCLSLGRYPVGNKGLRAKVLPVPDSPNLESKVLSPLRDKWDELFAFVHGVIKAPSEKGLAFCRGHDL